MSQISRAEIIAKYELGPDNTSVIKSYTDDQLRGIDSEDAYESSIHQRSFYSQIAAAVTRIAYNPVHDGFDVLMGTTLIHITGCKKSPNTRFLHDMARWKVKEQFSTCESILRALHDDGGMTLDMAEKAGGKSRELAEEYKKASEQRTHLKGQLAKDFREGFNALYGFSKWEEVEPIEQGPAQDREEAK